MSFVAVYLFWFRSKSQNRCDLSHRFHSQARAKTRTHPGVWPVCKLADITVLEILSQSQSLLTPKNSLKILGMLLSTVLFQYCVLN